MNSKDRIKELKTRQVFYGSSMVCKLVKKEGIFHYQVYAWIDQGVHVDTKILVSENRYTDTDPEILFSQALEILKLKKLKLGVPKIL